MKKLLTLAMVFVSVLTLAGCSRGADPHPDAAASKLASIPFLEDQFYAVAFLGYQEITDLSFYTEHYLDSEDVPIHHISDGEYYLVIPRYTGMTVHLYENNIQTSESTLIYEDTACRPFILQCNVSDIFPDATVRLTHQNKTAEFSPYISLMDGSVQPGDLGLDLTRKQ